MRVRNTGRHMQGRRRRDEPFNPFAPNASQNARDRREKREKNKPKPVVSQPVAKNSLAEMQRAAQKAIEKTETLIPKKDSTTTSTVKVEIVNEVKPEPQKPIPRPSKKVEENVSESRQERLARLAEKSAATAKFAKEASVVKPDLITEKAEELVPEIESIVEEDEQIEDPEMDLEAKLETKGAKNVFKTIKTEIKTKDTRGKKRRGSDKKGGGKQPQTKKLDRRKMLEYKYAAKDILNNESVKEEHRSNISAQIWAKGERTSVDSAIEFIKQKQMELILPEEIANELLALVKKYTTRR